MIETLITKVAQLLDRRKISYMIIGGQAVLLYGRPRLTRDIVIILAKNRDAIDFEYIDKWLSEFGKIPEHEDILARFNRLFKK